MTLDQHLIDLKIRVGGVISQIVDFLAEHRSLLEKLDGNREIVLLVLNNFFRGAKMVQLMYTSSLNELDLLPFPKAVSKYG